MCGIAGTVKFGGLDREGTIVALKSALSRLAPRGPDGEGVWTDEQCALGHRRLAVIDLSVNAAQPMKGHGAVIVFNGEIYNFAALRVELENLGRRFESRSDTEVLLAGWAQWGEALLPKLIGMFAFALWDPRAGELVLVRDRFGKKPLLYSTLPGRISFASDMLALERVAGQSFPLSRAALRWLFTLRFIPEPWCIGEGAQKLPAGHLLRITRSGLTVKRWYSLAVDPNRRPMTEDDAAIQIRVAIEAAVADRRVSDVPIGAFLSSGTDSAIVVAALAAAGGRVRTFTMGYEGSTDYYEERPAARELAGILGTQHVELNVRLDDMRDVIDRVFLGFDEPFGDSSAVPSYLVARETRNHVTVALSGDGADEVFAGYRKYQGEIYASLYRHIPQWLRKGCLEPLLSHMPEGKDSPHLEMIRRARRFVAYGADEPAARQAGWARLLTETAIDSLLPGVPRTEPLEMLIAGLRQQMSDADPVNAMLAAEVSLGLPGDMLVKVDRASMANGLEVRCPFLDQRVVEAAFALPGSFKLKRGRGKAILARAFADRLPKEIFRRPKKGFELPVAGWLQGGLADMVKAATDPVRLRRQGLFSPDLPARWCEELRSGRRDTAWEIWTLLAFQQWASLHQRPEALS